LDLTGKHKNKKLTDSMKKFAFLVLLLISADVLFIHSSNNIFLSNNASPADSTGALAPQDIHSGEGQLVSTLLSRYHYKKFNLDDSLSSIIFDRYLKTLDNNKSFFLAGDIDYIEQYRYALDDEFKSGNL
jgi:hypothetical protein